MKCRFVAEEAQHPISLLCSVIGATRRAEYYAARNGPLGDGASRTSV